ncbi:hypothetical protein ACFX1T_028231 [Malus domestica]
MLAKVGWWIICNPDSLLAKILRAKYYPTSSFLEAPMGRGTSWGWKGILQGQKILKGGLRWRIGDWRSIRIVKDPWLPTPHTFLPISQSGDMSLMVGDLMGVGGTSILLNDASMRRKLKTMVEPRVALEQLQSQ